MRIIIPAVVLFSFFVLGCKPSDAGGVTQAGEPVKVMDVARNYATLKLITPEPVRVSPVFAMMCADKSARPDSAAKKFGPHARALVRIFMNEGAAQAFSKKSGEYPVGSIVVKEKKRTDTSGSGGVGGMIKRAKGYDSDHGDWEYFYFDDPAKVESGKIESCVKCHAGAAGSGYVFGGWARGSAE